MTYTIEDVKHIIDQEVTPAQAEAIENFLNFGVVPPADPCQSCEPNFLRKLIGKIQAAQRRGVAIGVPSAAAGDKLVAILEADTSKDKPKPKPKAK